MISSQCIFHIFHCMRSKSNGTKWTLNQKTTNYCERQLIRNTFNSIASVWPRHIQFSKSIEIHFWRQYIVNRDSRYTHFLWLFENFSSSNWNRSTSLIHVIVIHVNKKSSIFVLYNNENISRVQAIDVLWRSRHQTIRGYWRKTCTTNADPNFCYIRGAFINHYSFDQLS